LATEQLLVGDRLDRIAHVVEAEQRDPAALAVDDAQLADDAGQEQRLARVDQVGDAQLGEAAHLGRALVEQVPREVEAERRLLEREALLDAPLARGDERRLLAARAVRVAVVEERVEQAALVGVRGLRLGPVERQAGAREQRRARRVDAVERAGLDQRLDDAAVDAAAVDARAEVEQARERTALLARRRRSPRSRRGRCP
jgi:hypothetical protein